MLVVAPPNAPGPRARVRVCDEDAQPRLREALAIQHFHRDRRLTF